MKDTKVIMVTAGALLIAAAAVFLARVMSPGKSLPNMQSTQQARSSEMGEEALESASLSQADENRSDAVLSPAEDETYHLTFTFVDTEGNDVEGAVVRMARVDDAEAIAKIRGADVGGGISEAKGRPHARIGGLTKGEYFVQIHHPDWVIQSSDALPTGRVTVPGAAVKTVLVEPIVGAYKVVGDAAILTMQTARNGIFMMPPGQMLGGRARAGFKDSLAEAADTVSFYTPRTPGGEAWVDLRIYLEKRGAFDYRLKLVPKSQFSEPEIIDVSGMPIPAQPVSATARVNAVDLSGRPVDSIEVSIDSHPGIRRGVLDRFTTRMNANTDRVVAVGEYGLRILPAPIAKYVTGDESLTVSATGGQANLRVAVDVFRVMLPAPDRARTVFAERVAGGKFKRLGGAVRYSAESGVHLPMGTYQVSWGRGKRFQFTVTDSDDTQTPELEAVK